MLDIVPAVAILAGAVGVFIGVLLLTLWLARDRRDGR